MEGAEAGAKAVVNHYKQLGSAIKTVGGAISGGVAGHTLAKKSAQEVAEKTLSRTATVAAKKAASKIIVKGAAKGTGVGTLVSVAGDVATYTAAGRPVVEKCQATYSSLANTNSPGGGARAVHDAW